MCDLALLIGTYTAQEVYSLLMRFKLALEGLANIFGHFNFKERILFPILSPWENQLAMGILSLV